MVGAFVIMMFSFIGTEAVTCGITFTLGGLKTNSLAQVLNEEVRPIAWLYAAGELAGNVYYVKYAGGAGLTSGSIMGRIVGAEPRPWPAIPLREGASPNSRGATPRLHPSRLGLLSAYRIKLHLGFVPVWNCEFDNGKTAVVQERNEPVATEIMVMLDFQPVRVGIFCIHDFPA